MNKELKGGHTYCIPYNSINFRSSSKVAKDGKFIKFLETLVFQSTVNLRFEAARFSFDQIAGHLSILHDHINIEFHS